MNFNASTGDSEKLHFDMLLLSIAYKVSAKKCRRIMLHDTEGWFNNLVSFNKSSGKSEKLQFHGLPLKKPCNVFELKKE